MTNNTMALSGLWKMFYFPILILATDSTLDEASPPSYLLHDMLPHNVTPAQLRCEPGKVSPLVVLCSLFEF